VGGGVIAPLGALASSPASGLLMALVQRPLSSRHDLTDLEATKLVPAGRQRSQEAGRQLPQVLIINVS